MLAAIYAVIASVRFARLVSTTHADARKERSRLVDSLSLLVERHQQNRVSGRAVEMAVALKNQQIAKQDSILAAPCRLTFPTFFTMDVGENHIGLSLAGFRCNFPILAKRYGEELPYAGNALGYRNWLGFHIDL